MPDDGNIQQTELGIRKNTDLGAYGTDTRRRTDPRICIDTDCGVPRTDSIVGNGTDSMILETDLRNKTDTSTQTRVPGLLNGATQTWPSSLVPLLAVPDDSQHLREL